MFEEFDSEDGAKKAHINSLFAMMAVDERFEETEVDVIRQIASRMGIRLEDHDMSTLSPQVFIPRTASERSALLADMKRVALADGVIHESEQKMLDMLEVFCNGADRATGETRSRPTKRAQSGGSSMTPVLVVLAVVVAVALVAYWLFG